MSRSRARDRSRPSRSGASTTLTPPSTNLLRQWTAESGVTKDGSDKVSAWLDQIGGESVTQGTGSAQPTWIASAQNSRPGVRFAAASSQYLQSLSSALAALLDGEDTPYTIYLVAKPASLSVSRYFYSLGRNSTTGYTSGSINASNLFTITRSGDTVGALAPTVTGAMTATTYVHAVSFAGTTLTVRRNGAVTSINGTAHDTGACSFDRFTIGALGRNTVANHIDGDIYELLVYSAAHDATAAAAVESYLNTKWAVY